MTIPWDEKGIGNSLCYLYDNSLVSFAQLVLAAQKNESKLLEAKKRQDVRQLK